MQEHRESENNYWGRFSSTYDRKIERMMGKGVRQNLFRLLERERGLGNAVEFGCGTGYFTRAIAENSGHVTATDLSSDMIEASKVNLKDVRNVSFQVEDSEATSFSSETFDSALMANMLHTVDDPLNALRECYRVLKKGGTLLVINYTDQGMGRVERTLLSFRFAILFRFPPKKNWPLTEEKLRSSLERSGFVIDRLDLIKDRINTFYVRAKKA